MIFKAFILLIAISYAHSSPVSKTELENKPTVENVLPKTVTSQPVESPKVPIAETAAEEPTEKRSARIARNNKVEYVYVNSNGEIIQPVQNAPPKDYHRLANAENIPYSLAHSSESYPPSTILKSNSPINEKAITGRSSESNSDYKLDDKLDSPPASLQYASGSIKVRQENLKTRGLTNALPVSQQQQQQNSPSLLPNLIQPYYQNYQPYSNYPLISSPYSSYPLTYPLALQNAYNPLLGNAGLYPNYAQSYLDPFLGGSNLLSRLSSPALGNGLNYLNPEELDLRRGILSPISAGSYLFGRQLNPIGYSPYSSQYYNPLLSYLLPQQSPNLNYLLNRNVNGLVGLNGYEGLIPPYLYPSYSPYLSNSLYPNNLLYPGLIPSLYPRQQQSNYPLASQQQALLPSTPAVVQPETSFVSRRVSTPTVVSTTTSTNVEPFTDTVVTPTVFNSPSSVSNSPSVIIPGNVESTETSNEKPLLYSNQNAALRTHSPIYDSTYYNGGNYLNSPYYNRIDPLTGLPIYQSRYQYGSNYSPYSRLTGYYGPNSGYSSIYRPGYIGTYPPNYFNNIGAYPFNSPMHYSVEPASSLLGRSGDKSEDKPVTGKGDQSKENNLMYTIKTSKTESKEVLSRLNNQETPKGLLDDKKA